MLKIIAEIRVSPMSVNQLELKSGMLPVKIFPRNHDCSERSALTLSKRRPVLKKIVMKTPLVINLVCSDSVSKSKDNDNDNNDYSESIVDTDNQVRYSIAHQQGEVCVVYVVIAESY